MDSLTPNVRLEVAPGQFISRDLHRLIRSVTVDATIDGADELVVVAEARDPISGAWRFTGTTILGAGSEVVVWSGSTALQRFRMVGEEVDYAGAPVVTLRGYSAEVRPHENTQPRVWPAPASDDDVVASIAGAHQITVLPGVSVDVLGQADKGRHKAAGDSDWTFLQQLATARGCERPWVRWDADRRRDVLYLRQARLDLQGDVAIFRWGTATPTLLRFSPSLSMAGVPTAVEVVGWDVGAGEPIRVRASISQQAVETTVQRGSEVGRLAEEIRSGAGLRARILKDGGQDPDLPEVRQLPGVRTAADAEAWAKRWLRTRSTAALTARATTVGYPAAWIGQAHRFEGVAPHHAGLWYAVGVQHRWDASGYHTEWDLERVVEER